MRASPRQKPPHATMPKPTGSTASWLTPAIVASSSKTERKSSSNKRNCLRTYRARNYGKEGNDDRSEKMVSIMLPKICLIQLRLFPYMILSDGNFTTVSCGNDTQFSRAVGSCFVLRAGYPGDIFICRDFQPIRHIFYTPCEA